MNVLTVNCGSSSVKVRLCRVDSARVFTLAQGEVEALGSEAVITFQSREGASTRSSLTAEDHATALRALLQLVQHEARPAIDAVGHRVVHGGAFAAASIIDPAIIRAIEAGQRVAPLHNRPSLEGINASRDELANIPMVAVFDTTFHDTLPEYASHYALPQDLTLKHGLRRYGYHGIAHRSMTERYTKLANAATDNVSLITLQLGSGCSATAVRNGLSVDTSMGFTPLEGLIMGTRPGDVDAGALSFLLREERLSPDELDDVLNHRSGLLGVSGRSSDMATLLTEETAGDARAHVAIEMFCYRVRKYIGAYIAVLGSVDAIVFGGGIGERSPEIRRRICTPLEAVGVWLDVGLNARGAGGAGRISADASPIATWVIASDEERVIARDTFEVVSRDQSSRSNT